MDILQALILAVLQGITEFLPVSSSAHLIIVPLLTEWQDQGLAYDVALNSATLLAVIIYFRSDIREMISGLIRAMIEKTLEGNHEARLALLIIFATIPVGLSGLFAHDIVATNLRTLEVIGISSIVWGVVLFIADRRPGKETVREIGLRHAIIVGLAQAIAIIPGTSRSGITITAGLFSGLNRVAAARFSFLLAIVVGILAGGHEAVGMVENASTTPWLAVIIGFVVAFIAAYLTIHYFLKFISHASMAPFVAYRVLLGVVLIGIGVLG